MNGVGLLTVVLGNALSLPQPLGGGAVASRKQFHVSGHLKEGGGSADVALQRRTGGEVARPVVVRPVSVGELRSKRKEEGEQVLASHGSMRACRVYLSYEVVGLAREREIGKVSQSSINEHRSVNGMRCMSPALTVHVTFSAFLALRY